MRQPKRILTTGLLIGIAALADPVDAPKLWSWNYSGAGIRASGTFTTLDSPDEQGGYLITAITGTRNGQTITALQPTGTWIPGNEPYAVDNLVFAGPGPQLTKAGFGFALADGTYSNPFYADFLPTPEYLEFYSMPDSDSSTELAVAFSATPVSTPPDWRMIGYDSQDNRTQPFERRIGVDNVSHLAKKWVAFTAGDVSATPAVVDGAVYFGDFGGMEWKLSAATGDVIWSHKISDYTGIGGDISRTSPTLAGDTLVIGDLSAPNIMGIDAKSGDLRWITKLDPDPHAIITGSPVLANGTIFVGTSQAGTSTYPGALVALNPQTGKILWRTYSLPNPDGFPGGYWGAVMFGPPAVDLQDGLVFATFKVAQGEPTAVKACNAAAPGGFSESCEQPGSYLSSIVAFDLKTGARVWSYRVVGEDPWQRACGSQPPAVTWCASESDNPLNGGDKWDLGGSGPNVFQIGHGPDKRTVVGVGEKSGVYIVLNAKTGEFIWNTLVGPGGDMGGMEWGTAYDGDRIYVSITNQHHIQYLLTDNGKLTSTTATGGSWAALDPDSGKIIWQRADPQTEVVGDQTVGVWDLAPVSAANGVVYVASMAKSGNEFYALNGATGEILWAWPAGSSVNAGPAIANGSVYWGSGYARAGAVEGSGNNLFFAFTIVQ